MTANRRVLLVGAAVAMAVWGAASPAFAHVGLDKDEVGAGTSTTLSFSFSHGCDEAPTNTMKFQIPEGIINAVPQVHAGWDVEVERAELDTPVESAHGDQVTDRPSVITFTARDGFEVPPGQRDTFTISFTAPETEGVLSFPVIQGCTEGSNDWIEPWDGTGSEPEHPAPFVRVVAAGDASGDDHGVADSGGDGDGGDDGSRTLAIVGIVLGAAGLIVGGSAVVRSGRAARGPAS
ncbi:MAG: YcnI family protein [Actinobacteria bacterium]|nr:YcnI family protein [Actinomycetota bacterium]